MPRYFLEVRYMGTRYSGFQIQPGAPTVQGEVERALGTVLRLPTDLTGSSRTDAGVHALSNYFHFDHPVALDIGVLRSVNAVLPADIAAVSLRRVPDEAHCRFDAVSRRYRYRLHTGKDPFLSDRSWFYPYPVSEDILHGIAGRLCGRADFRSFSKRRTQVGTYVCQIRDCRWERLEGAWQFEVEGDRFLRGMVRGLVGTMLKAARGRLDIEAFFDILRSQDNRCTDFTPPGRGLTLVAVKFSERLNIG
jgi:tRNA pseudouridine38-40 synthase